MEKTMIMKTERLILREMMEADFDALYQILADPKVMQHYPNTFDEIGVRNWAFRNTPFNMVYSYMKHTNEPSARTAIAYGCRQVDEFADEVNEITKVFAISREEWAV